MFLKCKTKNPGCISKNQNCFDVNKGFVNKYIFENIPEILIGFGLK